MDQRMRIAAATSVLLVGTVAALLFRRDLPPPSPPVPGTTDHLLLRKRVEPQSVTDETVWRQRGGCEASQSAPAGSQEAGPTTIVTPVDAGQPPDLARSYPNSNVPGSSRWGISMGQMLPETAFPEAAPRTHKIVDGDTLAALGERYLGSKDAAGAIFAANRDVLSDPQILPIGVELKIPAAASSPTDAAPTGQP
jgi:nucleoid-associated protein YgaU